MRVLICGSRDFDDGGAISSVLYGLYDKYKPLVVIEGGAKGADAHAAAWAALRGVEHEQYTADWARFGKRAGMMRNREMLREGKPDVVWAFVNKPLEWSRGTANMVGLARGAGIPTYVVEALPV